MELYCDGSCSSIDKAGGYAVVVIENDHIIETVSGGEIPTTNNRMEIMGCLTALKIAAQSHATIYIDSAYVFNAITQDWLSKWSKNNWITSSKTAVKNQDLWEEILLLFPNNCTFVKVAAHKGNKYNELADSLAVLVRNKQREED